MTVEKEWFKLLCAQSTDSRFYRNIARPSLVNHRHLNVLIDYHFIQFLFAADLSRFAIAESNRTKIFQ